MRLTFWSSPAGGGQVVWTPRWEAPMSRVARTLPGGQCTHYQPRFPCPGQEADAGWGSRKAGDRRPRDAGQPARKGLLGGCGLAGRAGSGRRRRRRRRLPRPGSRRGPRAPSATGAVPARSPPRPRPPPPTPPRPARPLLARPPARPSPAMKKLWVKKAFPGEGSGGGRRQEGRKGLGAPEEGGSPRQGPGRGRRSRACPTPADKAAESRARSRGLPGLRHRPPA